MQWLWSQAVVEGEDEETCLKMEPAGLQESKLKGARQRQQRSICQGNILLIRKSIESTTPAKGGTWH